MVNEKERCRSTAASVVVASFFLSCSVFARVQDSGFYIETPFVYQVENYCGPAALTMVFRYWGRSADQYELAGRYQPFPNKGLSGVQLKELAGEYGFSAYSFSGQPDEIRDHLRNGRPIIAALHSSTLLNLNHFVVVVGWDPSTEEWIVQDPAGRAYQRYGLEDFASRWEKLNNWALLLVPDPPG